MLAGAELRRKRRACAAACIYPRYRHPPGTSTRLRRAEQKTGNCGRSTTSRRGWHISGRRGRKLQAISTLYATGEGSKAPSPTPEIMAALGEVGVYAICYDLGLHPIIPSILPNHSGSRLPDIREDDRAGISATKVYAVLAMVQLMIGARRRPCTELGCCVVLATNLPMVSKARTLHFVSVVYCRLTLKLILSPASKSTASAHMPISSFTTEPGDTFSCRSCGWKGNWGCMLLLSSMCRCDARKMPI